MRGTSGKGGQLSASLWWRPLVLGRCGPPLSEAKALLGRRSLLLCSLYGSSPPCCDACSAVTTSLVLPCQPLCIGLQASLLSIRQPGEHIRENAARKTSRPHEPW